MVRAQRLPCSVAACDWLLRLRRRALRRQCGHSGCVRPGVASVGVRPPCECDLRQARPSPGPPLSHRDGGPPAAARTSPSAQGKGELRRAAARGPDGHFRPSERATGPAPGPSRGRGAGTDGWRCGARWGPASGPSTPAGAESAWSPPECGARATDRCRAPRCHAPTRPVKSFRTASSY